MTSRLYPSEDTMYSLSHLVLPDGQTERATTLFPFDLPWHVLLVPTPRLPQFLNKPTPPQTPTRSNAMATGPGVNSGDPASNKRCIPSID
ncbi:hypothetical protein BKA56DRAFT_243924 [Ilyonectria sp. MPI-CAGE-AT-0026]|nr:hypothetical protein BKA56DRAFT_243924 [Ilyonectria sp. MPI-CAGE-AT-0026]